MLLRFHPVLEPAFPSPIGCIMASEPTDNASPSTPESAPNPERNQAPGTPNPASKPAQKANTLQRRRVDPARRTISPYDLKPEELLPASAQLEKKGPWSNFIVFIISVALFMGSGLLSKSLQSVLILVAVIFVHESGHYAGMIFFKYRDVRMFFIPFFGGGVSGENEVVETWKEVIVLLLGPLPGILLGTAAAFACWYYPDRILYEYAAISIVVNLLNLLPILPFDGGRIANILIFSRVPALEALFRVFASVVLIAAGYISKAWLILGIGVIILLFTRQAYKIGIIASNLRPKVPVQISGAIPPLTHEAATLMVLPLRKQFPFYSKPEMFQSIAQQIWQKIHVRSPGIPMTLGIILICFLSFAGGSVGMVTLKKFSEQQLAQEKHPYNKLWDKAYVSVEQGRFVEAEGYYREAIALVEEYPDLKAEALFMLGRTCFEENKLAEAESALKECLKIREKILKPDNPLLPEALEEIAAVLRAQKGREAEANAYSLRAGGYRAANTVPTAPAVPNPQP